MGFFDFLGQSYGTFVGSVISGVLVVLIITCVVREVCYRRFGVDVCPGAAGSLTRARRQRQVMQDQRLAMEVQQGLEREHQQETSNRRRAERRAKYEVFLKPYTMVIRQDDFFREQTVSCTPTLQPYGRGDIETGSMPSSEDASHFLSSNMGEGEVSTSVLPVQAREDHTLLTLPVSAEDGKPRRVEASCSICLVDYEVGESVIWSTRKKCPHAFHDDCILSWLSTGKKRCPCCRFFFVPGQAVDDKKVIVDEGAEETANEESDGDNNYQATEEAIIEEIRSSAQTMIDAETGSPRRMSAYEPRLTHLPPEAETIAPSNTM